MNDLLTSNLQSFNCFGFSLVDFCFDVCIRKQTRALSSRSFITISNADFFQQTTLQKIFEYRQKLKAFSAIKIINRRLKSKICRLIEEISTIVSFLKQCGLPTSLKELGIENVSDEKLMEAAKASCADNDTMSNMSFDVTPWDVFAAIKAADRLSVSL